MSKSQSLDKQQRPSRLWKMTKWALVLVAGYFVIMTVGMYLIHLLTDKYGPQSIQTTVANMRWTLLPVRWVLYVGAFMLWPKIIDWKLRGTDTDPETIKLIKDRRWRFAVFILVIEGILLLR